MSHFAKRNNNSHSRPSQQHHNNSNDDFMFNRTSLLSSALQKLKKKNNKTSAPKRSFQQPIPLKGEAPSKKVKIASEVSMPSLTYTPLQKDLFNFYTINKISLKSFESVPEPKLQVGSTVLTAICDRGIGGKYLVTNLFRNKKAYIDYNDVPLQKTNDQSAIEALEAYQGPGDYVVGGVVKPRNPGKIQISLANIEEVNQKELRIGQVLIGEVKSKQELGCHLKVKGLKKIKAYLPKAYLSQDSYSELVQNKQILVSIKEIDEKKQLAKVIPLAEQQIPLNLRGIEEGQLSKFQIEHYVVPGTLVNTKIIKILSNGVLVKFLKIFIGFIHGDHLVKPLNSYSVEEKLIARIIYACNNPPTLFLSQRHRNIQTYEPTRDLYSVVSKPQDLKEIQHSYISSGDQFFAHPLHLHSQMQNLNKFWSKQNNFFERYQIMSSKKIGIQVGDIGKAIPFTNFKVYGQGEGKFRVMCLDIWNKVIKVSYDPKIISAKNLLYNEEDIDQNSKYCGFIGNVNSNGVVIEFCNNIKGIISQRQLQLNNIEINQENIGQAFEVYVIHKKKNYLGLTITPPELRKNKKDQHSQKDRQATDATGIIQSVKANSIHPIYVKIKSKIVKISIFDGIRPASLEDLPIIQDLESNFKVGEKVQVFSKKGKFYLYPPEQLSDKNLRFCRIINIQGNTLRVQIKDDEFRNCHICDVTDLISPHPLHELQVGDYTIGRIVNQKQITLRNSLVLNGLPENMKQITELYSKYEHQGDFRARIEAIGPSALKMETVVFGYIKNYSDRGCFISLSRNFDVRVDRAELSDQYIEQKEHVFVPNKLVLCRLINARNVTSGKNNTVQIDASLRESVVKYGYPLNDEILETGVGLTVKGVVTGYVKGKALVRLQSSNLTGIIALKDYEGLDENDTLEKVFPIGKELTCKIIEYSRQGQKRLIRLSTLNKFFKKYEGLETSFDCSPRIIQLWENFQQLSAIEAPEIQQKQISLNENNEEAEYKRLKKLLAENQIQIEGEQDNVDEQEEEQMEVQEDEQNEEEEMIDEQQESEEKKRQADANEKEEVERRVAQFEPLPHPKQFYQSLVLANPTPESYLLYISSLIPTASPADIRLQFQKAINSLTQIKDKDNMWISWLNTELILGDFTGTVKKAVEANVGHLVHFRIMQILCQQQNWPVAIEFGKKTLKKFNRQPKAYIAFLKLINQYQRSGHQIPDSLSTKQIMRRANQCLKTNNIIQIEVHHALSQFEQKQPEQGRNIMEKLVTSHPRRCDLWSVYIDQEVKYNNIDKARNLLERALSVGLKKKVTISLLKKYLQLQKKHGNAESVQGIIERAKHMASSYENIEEDDQQISQME